MCKCSPTIGVLAPSQCNGHSGASCDSTGSEHDVGGFPEELRCLLGAFCIFVCTVHAFFSQKVNCFCDLGTG